MIRWITLLVIIGCGVATIFIGRRRRLSAYLFWHRIIVAWLLLAVTCVIALLPLKSNNMANNVRNRDIIFVVDTTLSMNAVDGRTGNESTRLDDARNDMHTIASSNTGASIALFTFSDQTNLLLPLTTGSDDIDTTIDTTHTATRNTAISKVAPFNQVLNDLQTYVAAQKNSNSTRQRVVIMLSDFEVYNNQESAQQIQDAAKKMKANGAGFVGLVYGQTSGAKVLNIRFNYMTGEFVPAYKYKDEFDAGPKSEYETEFIKYQQNNGKSVVSVPNPSLGHTIATTLGGDSLEVNKSQDFNPIIAKAIKHSAQTAANSTQAQALSQNIWYIVPAFILFGWILVSTLIQPEWLRSLLPKSDSVNIVNGGNKDE